MATLGGEQVPADAGGPAPRLALAPDPIRCQQLIAMSGGGSNRCSRFSIKLEDGTRDRFCVSHSRSAQADALRSKAAKAQADARAAERTRRKALLCAISPYEWSIRDHFNYARYALFEALIVGDLSREDVRELRALLADAERTFKEWNHWPERFHNPTDKYEY